MTFIDGPDPPGQVRPTPRAKWRSRRRRPFPSSPETSPQRRRRTPVLLPRKLRTPRPISSISPPDSVTPDRGSISSSSLVFRTTRRVGSVRTRHANSDPLSEKEDILPACVRGRVAVFPLGAARPSSVSFFRTNVCPFAAARRRSPPRPGPLLGRTADGSGHQDRHAASVAAAPRRRCHSRPAEPEKADARAGGGLSASRWREGPGPPPTPDGPLGVLGWGRHQGRGGREEREERETVGRKTQR